MRRAILVAFFACLSACQGGQNDSSQARGETQFATVERIVDGDTLRVVVDGRRERVRIIGIDSPETHGGAECGGPEAAEHLDSLLAEVDQLELVADPTQPDRDKYDRLLRHVQTPAGADLGLTQLERGHARSRYWGAPHQRYDAFEQAEAAAKSQRRGMWLHCGS